MATTASAAGQLWSGQPSSRLPLPSKTKWWRRCRLAAASWAPGRRF
ncbi:hypothetical protein ACFU8W_38955 [Streptomyces sp. NPDC057565]